MKKETPQEYVNQWNKKYKSLLQDIQEYDILYQNYDNIDTIYSYTKRIKDKEEQDNEIMKRKKDLYNRKFYFNEKNTTYYTVVYHIIQYILYICLVIVSMMILFNKKFVPYGIYIILLWIFMFMIPSLPMPFHLPSVSEVL